MFANTVNVLLASQQAGADTDFLAQEHPHEQSQLRHIATRHCSGHDKLTMSVASRPKDGAVFYAGMLLAVQLNSQTRERWHESPVCQKKREDNHVCYVRAQM
jgi:hypothetical protein